MTRLQSMVCQGKDQVRHNLGDEHIVVTRGPCFAPAIIKQGPIPSLLIEACKAWILQGP